MLLLTEEDLERSRRIREEHEAAGDTTFQQNRDAGEETLVAHAGVVNGWRQNGAALPPAQGGPSFSQTEMQVLAGGQPPAERWTRPEERTAQPAAFDLDAVKKEVEDSLSTIDTTAALEDARKNLGKVLATELENPPMIEVGEAKSRSAAGDESWRLPPEEQAKWERVQKNNLAAAKRRMEARATGVAGRARMTTEQAEQSEDTFHFPSLEELDAERPSPW